MHRASFPPTAPHMDPSIPDRLSANAGVVRYLLEGVDVDQARWRPVPAKWSLLEVVNHLADEEREDFRTRLDLTLHRPGHPWPPIDPEGWVRARDYDSRDPAGSLEDFLRERQASVAWLRGLTDFDPTASYAHPTRGPISAGTLLHSWVAHDLIHIRQMTRLHYEFLRDTASGDALGYAGEW